MYRPSYVCSLACLVLAALLLVRPTRAQETPPPPDAKQIHAARQGALAWLAANQIQEGSDAGSWPGAQYQTAVASLSGLAFLANGYIPGEGPYGQAIDRAMTYVRLSQAPDGYLGARGDSMYVHAICTLFGLAYLGATPHPEQNKLVADMCRKSIFVIIEAQKIPKRPREQGGWRYSPQSMESDLSVTSWQLLVLHAARQCGYRIDDAVFDHAIKMLNDSFKDLGPDQGGFLYRNGVSLAPEPGVTGTAVFMKSLLEKEPDDKYAKAMRYLAQFPPRWGGTQYKGYFFFVTFYLAQGMFQAGDDAWATYDAQLKTVLVEHQHGDGHWPFPPDSQNEERSAGLAYTTAMGSLILSLDQQYLPMYQRQRALYH